MLLAPKGMETVLQGCCRDRNYGGHHKARSVYDLQLVELLSVIQKLQAG
ncbi:hypothetical protein DFAR_3990026 [Desulfarculales bacterium]